MTLNELRDNAYAYADKQGFHENVNFGEKLMLVIRVNVKNCLILIRFFAEAVFTE
jgi:hypothetical protein